MMENIISYIKWRGDISFQERPFNELDNLVFSQLVYLNFKKIVPNDCGSITLEEAELKYADRKKRCGPDELNREIEKLLELAAHSKRFKDIQLSNYRDVLDYDDEQTQFAAMCIRWDTDKYYMAFRGTDDTIVGWQEDFSISFQIAPAQFRAVSYMNEVIQLGSEYIAGGHSKGGNLAVYGTMMCEKEKQDCIKKIYSNDGPGLCWEIADENKYRQIEERIVKIVPQYSVIGMLFEETDNLKIVQSSVEGVLAHDVMTWQVEGERLIECQELNKKCKLLNNIIDNWAEKVDMEQRKIFTNEFFDALKAGGALNMGEVAHGGTGGFEDILTAMAYSDRNTKIVIGKFVKSFLESCRKIDIREFLKSQKIVQDIIMFVIGTLFIITPAFAQRIIGTGFFVWILLFSLSRLYIFNRLIKNGKAVPKIKIYFYLIIAVIEILCIIINNIIVLSTNLIIGFFFVWRAYKLIQKSMQYKNAHKKWKMLCLHAFFAGCMAIVGFSFLGSVSAGFILITGTYLVICGMVEVAKEIYATSQYNN